MCRCLLKVERERVCVLVPLRGRERESVGASER